jgi:hypothetical protein
MSSPAAVFIAPPRKRRRVLTPAGAFAISVVALLWFGAHFPIARYISPQRGLGYALGIVGGSMMLLLLLYPLRKRVRWLGVLGSMKVWFRAHMVLGVLGPLLVLYHSNFSTGATNSNVALACMLIVSGSGLFGRYVYAKIHHGLYGNRATLAEMRSDSDRVRGQSATVQFLPQLAQRLSATEDSMIRIAALPGLSMVSPIVLAVYRLFCKIRLRRYVSNELRRAAYRSATLMQHRPRLTRAAYDYVNRRLNAASRVATFHAYERLFSVWHVLHLPLFFMLIVAGIVHVVAVHTY